MPVPAHLSMGVSVPHGCSGTLRGLSPGLVLGDAIVTRHHCPRPHVRLWSLSGISLCCGPEWFKVSVFSPTPAPGLIKLLWGGGTTNHCRCCLFPDSPMGTTSFLKRGPGSALHLEPPGVGAPG